MYTTLRWKKKTWKNTEDLVRFEKDKTGQVMMCHGKDVLEKAAQQAQGEIRKEYEKATGNVTGDKEFRYLQLKNNQIKAKTVGGKCRFD